MSVATPTTVPAPTSALGSKPEPIPLHDTPILGMPSRPHVQRATIYGGTLDVDGGAGFWVEYPDGLMDLTRSHLIPSGEGLLGVKANAAGVQNGPAAREEDEKPPALDVETQVEMEVEGEPKRRIRVSKEKSALVVIDMQKYVGTTLRIRQTESSCNTVSSCIRI